MADQNSPILYEKIWIKYTIKRVIDVLILLLLLLLLGYRVISLNNNYSLPWFVALLCESWFTVIWVLNLSIRWTPAVIKTHPDRLLQRVGVGELPPVDLFVTTADPVLEPPIITVNTVLSLLALDYPAHKLACYVSDDGCSPLTFYALREASKFAKFWIPFCKKYHVLVRAPFRYFSDEPDDEAFQPAFKREWLRMKDMYEHLSRKIEDAAQKSIPCQLVGEFAVFSNIERTNHPAIIQVIWENKENLSDGLPHLIYISREKRPKHPHYYKAGAMNVLTRVSGLMTNAPFMLNVDCDMFVNNPKAFLHAMCVLLDSKGKKEVAFAQFPQKFYGVLKDDPFGNQMAVFSKYILEEGLAGLQGPFYMGTNCFHRRKVIYGLSQDNVEKGNNISEEELIHKFGPSKDLVKSAAHAFKEKTYSPNDNVSNALEAASQVASCEYEYGNGWGSQVGWIYGSLLEDMVTGLTIHEKGWRSEMCTLDPIAFMGCAPRGATTSMTHHKRAVTGLLEIFFDKRCPIFGTLFRKLHLRQSLAYLWITCWGFRPLFEICYASLVAYCLITNSNFLTKELGLCIPVALFVTYQVHTLSEYLVTGLSVRAWWNNQRMSRIYAMNAWLFAFFSFLLKLLRISNTVFDITMKEEAHSDDSANNEDSGRFTFDESPMFVPGTTILLLQLTALVIKLLGLQPTASTESGNGSGLGEMFCCVYLIICYWPFFRGLFEKGKYRIPLSTVFKSAALAFLFVHLCRRTIAS